MPPIRTKVMVNVGNPSEVFPISALPCDGVGLARLEFIIANIIKTHPLALIHFDKVKDAKVSIISKIFWPTRFDFFSERLVMPSQR